MHTIRTAEDLARALDSPLDTELSHILQTIADRLAEYADFAFEQLAQIVIVDAGTTVEGVCSAAGLPLLSGGQTAFALNPEIVVQHARYIELVFVLSDDGFGLILVIEIANNTNADLLALCELALQEHDAFVSRDLG